MNLARTFATAGRVLSQIRHDPRTIGLLLVVPSLLIGLVAWMFTDTDVFASIGPGDARPVPVHRDVPRHEHRHAARAAHRHARATLLDAARQGRLHPRLRARVRLPRHLPDGDRGLVRGVGVRPRDRGLASGCSSPSRSATRCSAPRSACSRARSPAPSSRSCSSCRCSSSRRCCSAASSCRPTSCRPCSRRSAEWLPLTFAIDALNAVATRRRGRRVDRDEAPGGRRVDRRLDRASARSRSGVARRRGQAPAAP